MAMQYGVSWYGNETWQCSVAGMGMRHGNACRVLVNASYL